jgi:hypothetical protein
MVALNEMEREVAETFSSVYNVCERLLLCDERGSKLMRTGLPIMKMTTCLRKEKAFKKWTNDFDRLSYVERKKTNLFNFDKCAGEYHPRFYVQT